MFCISLDFCSKCGRESVLIASHSQHLTINYAKNVHCIKIYPLKSYWVNIRLIYKYKST